MGNWIIGMLDRICAVAGALLFAQAPVFMQQYLYRLGGHVSELQHLVNSITAAAGKSGKTLTEYLHKFLASSDPDVIKQGEMMQGIVDRLGELSYSLTVLSNGSIFVKPFLFTYYAKSSILASTFDSYQFGLSLTVEAAAYALFGITIGYLIFLTIRKLIRKSVSVLMR